MKWRALKACRRKLSTFIESPHATAVITLLIVANAIALGLETDRGIMAAYGGWLNGLDQLILLVFTAELAIKLFAYRLSFFRSGWNVFDFVIVAIAWIPAAGPLTILRALRVLRVMRLLSMIQIGRASCRERV